MVVDPREEVEVDLEGAAEVHLVVGAVLEGGEARVDEVVPVDRLGGLGHQVRQQIPAFFISNHCFTDDFQTAQSYSSKLARLL